jgi:hypothetical protein
MEMDVLGGQRLCVTGVGSFSGVCDGVLDVKGASLW